MHQLTLVYSFCNNLLPIELNSLFVLDSNIHNHVTRSASHNLLHIPRVFTSTFGINSIKYTSPILWNFFAKNGIAIDSNKDNNINIDHIHNRFQFARTLKKHFMYHYSL